MPNFENATQVIHVMCVGLSSSNTENELSKLTGVYDRVAEISVVMVAVVVVDAIQTFDSGSVYLCNSRSLKG